MVTKCSLVHHNIICVALNLLLFFFPVATFDNIVGMKPKRFVMKLIHHNSVFHPNYNPNDTITDRALRDIRSSRERFEYLQAKIRRSAKNDYKANIYPTLDNHIFCANFSIGKPPVPQLAVIDTGSNIMWVQCVPCKDCFKQYIPTFNPSKSSTFVNLSCTSPFCKTRRFSCNPFHQCSFVIEYMDDTNAQGVMATEQLTFLTSDDGYSVASNIVLGCTHRSQAITDGRLSGAIGLGTEPISLASQLGGKFSYCIGSVIDPNYMYNQLVLGDGADFEGYPTPFEIYAGSYYLTLEDISIGETRLGLPSITFRRSSYGEGGVIIDSGSTLTHLIKEGYDRLSTEVIKLMDKVLQRVPDKFPWTLCYRGKVNQDLEGFPVVTFHFAWGADLVSDASSFFYQKELDVFCMAVQPSNPFSPDVRGEELTTIGVMAQQNYNVAYDLNAKKMYIQRIDCELLNE